MGRGWTRSSSAQPIARPKRTHQRASGCQSFSRVSTDFPQGIPTANVSGLANFCTLERSPLPEYDYLIRFRGRAAGNIIVTVRVAGVEQVFCTDQEGNAIAFANLTDPSPAFVVVSQQDVAELNPLVGAMIR